MKFKFAAFSLSAAVLSASLAFADKTPMSGTIISMQSVECGSKKKGKTSTSLLCHQYVVRTTTAEYQLRQQKPAEEHVFPANTPIQFTVPVHFSGRGNPCFLIPVFFSPVSCSLLPSNHINHPLRAPSSSRKDPQTSQFGRPTRRFVIA